MWRWFGLGLLVIAVLAVANIAYAVTAIGSSAADLSRLDVRNSSVFVDLIPSRRSGAILVRLKLHGGLWLTGFGRRDWFSGVIEAEELQVLDWDRPWNGDDIRLTLRAERDELDPAENIRFAFREGKAERLEDYEGLRTYRLAWHENSIQIRILGEPGEDRFSAIICFQHGCYTDLRIGPNLIARLDLPDIRQHGGRDYANRVIADVGRKVCDMLVDAICWADR
jgi:hypothetical protein